MSYIPVLFVFLPIITSIFIYLFKNEKFSRIVFIIQPLMILLFVLYAIFIHQNPDQGYLILGGTEEAIRISFYNDSLSLTFVGLTTIMWMAVLLYTFKTNKKESKFLFFLMFLQGVFMGMLQTNDLFNLFVFIELIAVLVTILIAYNKTGPSFRASIYYLLLNALAAVIFLIGIIFIYYVFGTINIQIIKANIHTHADTHIIKLACVFVMAGIGVRGAWFPV